MDPLYIPNSIFSFVGFVFVIKLQRIIHCIDGICTWVLCLFLLMSVFTITQTYRISIIIFSPSTHVLYYMHYPFFLVCSKQAIFYHSFYCFMLMRYLSLVFFRVHFSFTCSWTYVCTAVGWHEESTYISCKNVF